MRPQTLDQIIGQKRAKEVIKTLINFSQKNNKPIPHILLSSPPGLGKTTIAQAIANETKSNLFSVNCATIGNSKRLFKIIDEMTENSILLLDEIHNLTKKTSESIYNVLEDFFYFEEGMKVKIPPITVIGASTEIGKLPIPLKDRFKFTATLEPYTNDELIEVCLNICKKNSLDIDREIAEVIANTSRGIPRLIVSRAEWVFAYLSGNSSTSNISKDKILEIISLQGVDEHGFEKHDIKYLKILYESKTGLSLDSISSKIHMDKENVAKLIEPYMIKLGLIEKYQGRGRMLTSKGKKFIESYNNAKI